MAKQYYIATKTNNGPFKTIANARKAAMKYVVLKHPVAVTAYTETTGKVHQGFVVASPTTFEHIPTGRGVHARDPLWVTTGYFSDGKIAKGVCHILRADGTLGICIGDYEHPDLKVMDRNGKVIYDPKRSRRGRVASAVVSGVLGAIGSIPLRG